ncbi:transglutaminase family protein [Streptosporangium lutulentum]
MTERNASSYEKAVQLQEFFTKEGGFTYSLATQGNNASALVDFLIRNRTGYCEQFASSMAVLARVLGIPARVAIGYTSGTNLAGQWQVRTHDSHAWPELYFEGAGWLRFEPTPTGGGGQGTATLPSYSLPEVAPATTDEPTTSPSSGPDTPDQPGGSASNRGDDLLDPESGGMPIAVDEGVPPTAKIGIGVVIALLIALIPGMLRVELRARRRRSYSREVKTSPGGAGSPGPGDPAAPELADVASVRIHRWEPAVRAAWSELDDALCDYGMSRQSSESPRALARRLSEQYGFDAETTAATARIATVVERMLYARTPGEIGSLHEDLHRVRRALAATVTRGRRIRAVLLPPSTLRRMRAMGGRLLDGFDRLENIRFRRPVGKDA